MTDVVPSNTIDAMHEAEMIQAFVEKYPTLDPNNNLIELLEDNIGSAEEGGGITFSDLDRVTVTPGGTPSWVVPDLLAGETMVKKLTGIVLRWEASRAYWDSTDLSDSPPDCSSRDGVTPIPGGLYAEGGERADENPPMPYTVRGVEVVDPETGQPALRVSCANCPMNQFGSSLKGTGGKGCKESRLLYLMRPGESLPTIVSLPPTSIRPLKSFLLKVGAAKGKRYNQIEIGLSLKTVTKGGNSYGEVVPNLERILENSEAALAEAASEEFAGLLQRAPVPTLAIASGEGTTTQAES